MSRESQALAVAILTELAKRVKAAGDTARRDLRGVMPVEAREPVRVPTPDGPVKVASITHAKGSTTAHVTDEAALLSWCEENYPDEIVTTRHVRTSFSAWLIAQAQKDGIAVDKHGQIIPGITVSTGEPKITVTIEKNPDAIAALVAYIASTPTALDAVLALPAGES